MGKRDPTEIDERQTRQIIEDLRAEGYVRTLPYFSPVHGLTAPGVELAKERDFPHPKELFAEHSLFTLEHELKRGRMHELTEGLCEQNGWDLYWQKTDLFRMVEPDDLFAIKRNGVSTYFFYELENKKKTFKDLYEKCRRYFDLYGTDKCRKLWGDFSTFNVIFQFANATRRTNFLEYLSGVCNCTYYRGKLRHTCLKETNGHPIKTTNFLFTTDELITKDIGGEIFATPKDYLERDYSFLSP